MRKIIKQPIDNESKLNDSGRMIVEIAHRQLQVLMNKMALEELAPDDIRKFETLTRIVNSQQKHAIDIEKLQSGEKEETHNHLHLNQEQLDKLLEAKKNAK